MKELISIIVPIYRVESYLRECIDSIMYQTYSELEIILVDDGSDDDCPKICDEYQEKDSRIRVIHKSNGGLSDARNVGLNCATGEYICFVDSDDVIHPNFIQCLYEDLISTNSDIAICHYEKVCEISKETSMSTQHSMQVYTKNEILDALYGKESLSIIVAWNKLYRRNIWDQLRYPKGKIHEDEFVIHYILDKINQVVIDSETYYYYRQREGSITSQYNEKRLHALEAMEDRIAFYKSIGNDKMIYRTMYQYFYVIVNHICQIKHLKKYKILKKQLKNKLFYLFKNLIWKKHISVVRKVKMFIFLAYYLWR